MQTETIIEHVTKKLEELLADHPSHFLVEIRIKPTNNIKVFIDGDEGVVLSQLVDYNRKLYRDLEAGALFPDGDFSLEVSSPGLSEPLKSLRQYKKNVGRYLDIQMLDGSSKEGKLMEATEDGLVLETETGKGKKKEIKQETVLFDQIKNSKVQIKFS